MYLTFEGEPRLKSSQFSQNLRGSGFLRLFKRFKILYVQFTFYIKKLQRFPWNIEDIINKATRPGLTISIIYSYIPTNLLVDKQIVILQS
jgi:hypothetical protein